ncbi:unnamed protein product, partial [Closterium sp. NIES-53]
YFYTSLTCSPRACSKPQVEVRHGGSEGTLCRGVERDEPPQGHGVSRRRPPLDRLLLPPHRIPLSLILIPELHFSTPCLPLSRTIRVNLPNLRWRIGAEVRKVHFAEEWNEMNHLKIMESLGGDRLWVDRFFAQHAAILYYWVLNFMFLISPRTAYNFSELIEAHAVDTYGEFVDENEELLKTLPPSPAAIAYYNSDDLYMFDEFQTSRVPESRRPKIESLYDVFCAIRDDEMEHVKTMSACQQLDSVVRSPNRPGYAPLPSPADVYFEGLVVKTSSSTSAPGGVKVTPSTAAASAFSAAVGEAKLPKDVLPQALKSRGESLK